MSRALAEYQVLGIRTTIPFFVWLMRQDDVSRAHGTTPPGSIACSTARRGQSFSELRAATRSCSWRWRPRSIPTCARSADAGQAPAVAPPGQLAAGGAGRGAARVTR